MKVVFAGPSLHRFPRAQHPAIDFRGPALQGDVYRAVEAGADAIGIIDGFFESVSSIWHKEILYALSRGVRVLGASSMGALRAAECAEFGMVGVGRIFEAYRGGALLDDEAVALSHAPSELDYMPLTVPLVNVMWSTEHWRANHQITSHEQKQLLISARNMFFKDRIWKGVVDGAALSSARRDDVLVLARTSSIDRKSLDAQELVQFMDGLGSDLASPPHWRFSHTHQFARFFAKRGPNENAL